MRVPLRQSGRMVWNTPKQVNSAKIVLIFRRGIKL